MRVIRVPPSFDDGLPALGKALYDALNAAQGKAVLIRCEYCGNCDGPFIFFGITPQIIEVPFNNDWVELVVTYCRDCMR